MIAERSDPDFFDPDFGDLEYFGGEALHALLQPGDAVTAIESALRDGLDPEEDAPRASSPLPGGEFLLMPSHTTRFAGVKVATVAPGNAARDLPRIQGLYLLFDAVTLTPLAVMDGAALTLIRTPAVTITAIKHLLRAGSTGEERVDRLAVIGTSVQAWQHIRTAVAALDVGEVVVVGRRSGNAEQLASRAADDGVDARAGSHADLDEADVIICATSSRTPVFDGRRVKTTGVVAAIGSHGLAAREVDETLVRRADVVVESRASALHESGDLIPARSAADWERIGLTSLVDLVTGRMRRRPDAPALYTGVGMSWEDLVLASHAYSARDRGGTLRQSGQ